MFLHAAIRRSYTGKGGKEEVMSRVARAQGIRRLLFFHFFYLPTSYLKGWEDGFSTAHIGRAVFPISAELEGVARCFPNCAH